MNKVELFDLVFNDGEIYTNFYFNKRRNKVISYQENLNGNTIALVNCVEISISDKKQTFKTALITGVCTHPNFRAKGIMQNLLSSTLATLKKQNYDFAILSPRDDNYYKKYGFHSLIKGNWKQINFQKNNDYSARNATKIDTNLLFELYESYLKQAKYYQCLSKEVLFDLIEEFSMDNCSIKLIYQKNIPIGWIATDENRIEIAIVPDLNILHNIGELNGFYYFEPNAEGTKDLFQIKYFNNKIKSIETNSIFILNKY